MAYVKQNFSDGQVLTAAHLNHIETGLKELESSGGTDGFSPTISVSNITGGHRLSITDANGTKTVDVMNGGKGDPGTDGRGIVNITRTSGTGAAGSTDVYTITYTDNTTSTFTVYNGANGTGGGSDGDGGENGATFTPSVDSNGNLSWSNDKGLANPATVNIKGPAGADGVSGKDGEDGVSCTHSWSGTTLTVTSASGTTSADLKGDKGDKGDKGNVGPTGPTGAAGKSAYLYAQEGGYTGSEAEFSAMLAARNLKMMCVWENASPDSTMAAGVTAQANLSGCEMVAIRAKFTNTLQGTGVFFGRLNSRVNMMMASTSAKVSLRTADVGDATTNLVTFNAGYADGSTSTSAVIPLEIYGIRGVEL